MVEIDAGVADELFEPALDRFRRLGLAVRMIMPADDPAVALLEGGGIAIRLVRGDTRWPVHRHRCRARCTSTTSASS